ncbi:MAG: hypothetical protein ABSG42_06245 [Nitrospirota bacterium]
MAVAAAASIFAYSPGASCDTFGNQTGVSCAPASKPLDMAAFEKQVAGLNTGDRIVFWAERFIGVPYDTDPLGAYVRSCRIVYDSEVDCMYQVFRAVELALTKTPQEAEQKALDLRFKTRGRVEGGRVVNYGERFQYAEDMIASGKWGKDITGEVGAAREVPGSRGSGPVSYLPKEELLKKDVRSKLKNGDLIFFVKDPKKRITGEVVGHLGIIKVDGEKLLLIHASGSKATKDKKGGGRVKEVGLPDYIAKMNFIGAKITRFPDDL